MHPRNPLNIGAAARAMANFGFAELWLVAPYDAAWRSARSARAGQSVLANAQVCATLAEAVAGCRPVVGTTAGTARRPELPLEPWLSVAPALRSGHGALLFGSEKTGLSVEEMSHCHRLARIETTVGAPSLNLGQAVALCCYELRRETMPLPDDAAGLPPPGGAGLERLVETWMPLLEALGVSRAQHRPSQHRRLRAMLLRWHITAADERRLLGIARQLRHALARLPASAAARPAAAADPSEPRQ